MTELHARTCFAGLSSSSSTSESLSLWSWLRAAKMFLPWKGHRHRSRCQQYRGQRWSTVEPKDKPWCSCLFYLKRSLWKVKESLLKCKVWCFGLVVICHTWLIFLITCLHREHFQLQHDVFIVAHVPLDFPSVSFLFLRLESTGSNSNVRIRAGCHLHLKCYYGLQVK